MENFDEDVKLIEQPNDLGDYADCKILAGFIQDALNDGQRLNRLYLNINNQKYDLNAVTIDLGYITRESVRTFLSDCNSDIISPKYFIVLDPETDIISAFDVDGNNMSVPKKPFLAYARPRVMYDGVLEWNINSKNDMDTTGIGAKSLSINDTPVVFMTSRRPSTFMA